MKYKVEKVKFNNSSQKFCSLLFDLKINSEQTRFCMQKVFC